MTIKNVPMQEAIDYIQESQNEIFNAFADELDSLRRRLDKLEKGKKLINMENKNLD